MREGRGGGELPGDVRSDADFSEEGSSKVNLCVYEATIALVSHYQHTATPHIPRATLINARPCPHHSN